MPVLAPTGSDDMTMNAIYKRHSFYNLGHIFAGAKHNLLAQAVNKDRRILCEICYPKGHIIWLIYFKDVQKAKDYSNVQMCLTPKILVVTLIIPAALDPARATRAFQRNMQPSNNYFL